MLHVHRSESATALVAGLADVLRTSPSDPFGADLVAVGAKGTERWIAQRLSHHLGADGAAGDGICARVDFTSPAAMLDTAVAAASPEHAEAVDRWSRDRLTWHVLDVLDDLAEDPGDARFHVLRHHLRTVADGGSPRVRRVAAAERLAGLLGRYSAARPELLPHWAAGADTGVAGAPLAEDLRWQPELFRRVREHVGVPSPAELLGDACRVLRTDPGTTDLPERLNVFVVTRLATARLQVLAALAEHRETHLWLQHASPALWESLRGNAPAGGSRAAAEAVAQGTVRHPLLQSLARDVRELQGRLATLAPGAADEHHPGPAPQATLLGALQRDLADDRVPARGSAGAAARPVLAAGDRSVQVHACHGRARQVEVLREVVLGLLDGDRSLQPRDVLVMCPDVETFAPLVTAVFSTDSHPGGGLRVAVADRSPLQTNPLLSVAARLLELAAGRVTATDVLDLAGASAVRLRFGFDDEALEQVREWTVDAGVHWGLGPDHRRAWELGDVGQGSWRAGLDRVLVGVALGGGDGDVLLAEEAERGTGGLRSQPVVPLSDVESSRVDLAGRFAELLDRLDAVVTSFTGSHPVPHWCDALLEGVLSLTDTPRDGSWQVAQLRRELGVVREDAARAGAARVGLTDVGALLADRLAGRPQRSSFRTGAMTVCTMTPMRSVPHRVVCLLGLDDGAFPRVTTVDGDDLLARDPQVGDRDPRSEDRQVLLDAVGAAERHLVITYSGHDVRTGAILPPAVPVGELLDALDATATTADGRPVREHVVVHHPLQPTDPRNFTAGVLGREGPLSYDTTAHRGALAAQRPPVPVPPFLDAALPAPRDGGDVDLDRLVQFWQHPVRGLLRQRLEVAGTVRADEPDNALPVQLDALQEWAIGDRCLAARLAGIDAVTLARVETARGDLPPGVLGTTLLRKVGGRVDQLVTAATPYAGLDRRAVDVEVDLPDGTRLTGVVGGVRTTAADGDLALTTTYSRVKGKQRLRAWIDLLALSAAHPGQDWTAVVVGRGSRDTTAVVTLGPVDPASARAALADLVTLRRVGLSVALPLPVGAGSAWAGARHRGRSPGSAVEAARSEWTSGYSYPREDAEEEHVLVWGLAAPVEVLLQWTPPAGAPPEAPRSFAELAERVWRPLLDAQRLEER
ncbi:exodeoxyribonuclease V subunit gamma [Kineococcus rubinsiae]|uniref:exodeoxyribonuclease V subunit gamma n=1 Tax=Kineococcus rubinsiae TaxID=2609562 RepID=UPI0014311108|nr:exodeoxyribonuclease V subunit gamma [Kineococcus rubinsiae]NIZ89424.1 exodeoxyribonuclease V subunit gamma [Kineococcus rubinsiae]